MEENKSPVQETPDSGLKSFSLYTGKKAPILIQIFGGLIWLGAAGLLLQGLMYLILSPIIGIVMLALGVFAVITGKSLFAMRKTAIRNSAIMAIAFIAVGVWGLVSSGLTNGLTTISPALYGTALGLVVYLYKGRFAN